MGKTNQEKSTEGKAKRMQEKKLRKQNDKDINYEEERVSETLINNNENVENAFGVGYTLEVVNSKRKRRNAESNLCRGHLNGDNEQEASLISELGGLRRPNVENLFSEIDEGNFSIENINKLKVNSNFAQRYEMKKKKEDLSKNKELLEKNSDDSTSEEDDESAILLTKKTTNKIFDILVKIKTKDSSIYDSSNRFFNDSDFEIDNELEKTNDAQKK